MWQTIIGLDGQLISLWRDSYRNQDSISVTLTLVVTAAVHTTCRRRRDALKNNELKSWRLDLTTPLCSKSLSLRTVTAALINENGRKVEGLDWRSGSLATPCYGVISLTRWLLSGQELAVHENPSSSSSLLTSSSSSSSYNNACKINLSLCLTN
jgi:hypothetical protein